MFYVATYFSMHMDNIWVSQQRFVYQNPEFHQLDFTFNFTQL